MNGVYTFCTLLKITLLVVVLLLGQPQAMAQGIGINTDGSAPDASALLDIQSPATGVQLGLLLPRTDIATATFTSPGPATYLQLVNTNPSYAFPANSRFNTGIGMYMNFGTPASPVWRRFLTSADSTMFWGLRGNNISSGDFIGTINNFPLRLFSRNTERLIVPTSNSGYIEAINVAGFLVPNCSTPQDVAYSINSSSYGLSANSGTQYTALRFGASGYLKGVNGTGVIISTGPTNNPTEWLEVYGNIYTRERIIYTAYNTLAVNFAQNDKTGKVERYWSGSFPSGGSSLPIFQETGNDGIRFRVTKTAGGIYTIDAAVQGLWAGDYSQDGNVLTLVAGGPWGAYVAVTPGFSGANSSHEFTLTRRTNTGGNDTYPVYLIRAIINSDNDNIKVIIEAWYKQ